MCSLGFGIGSLAGEGFSGDISIKLRFVSPDGKTLHQDEIATTLDDSESGRYREVFIEDEKVCFEASTRVHVTNATATVGKRKINLLKSKKLVVDEFKPMTIIVPR